VREHPSSSKEYSSFHRVPVVVFSGTITPLPFNDDGNVKAIEEAVNSHHHVILVWQEGPGLETVTPENLPKLGMQHSWCALCVKATTTP